MPIAVSSSDSKRPLRYNEVENAKKSLDVSVGCEHYDAKEA